MKIENNQIIIDESDLADALPFNDNMSKAECYIKGMLDFAETVKSKIDNARLAKEQHSYMYCGNIFDSLLDDLEHLTSSVTAFKYSPPVKKGQAYVIKKFSGEFLPNDYFEGISDFELKHCRSGKIVKMSRETIKDFICVGDYDVKMAAPISPECLELISKVIGK